jgi:MFS family permease
MAQKKVVLACLAVAAASFAFQETAVLPALPAIQRQLHGSKSASALLESAYLVIASVAAPLLGKLGDRFGKRRLALVTLAVYLAGAIGAALAPAMWVLIAFRAVQGVGGAVFGLSFAIMRDLVGTGGLGSVIGVLVGAFGLGMTAAFSLEGAIVSGLGWRWIFWIGAMVVGVSIALVALGVPRSKERHGDRTDFLGALLLGAGPSAIVIAVAISPTLGWASWGPLLLYGVGVALVGLWILREKHTSEPLLDVSVLARRVVLLPDLGSFLGGWAAFSILFLTPRLVQAPRHAAAAAASRLGYGFGASELATGFFLVPFSVGLLIAGPSGGLVGRKWGGKWPFVIGMALLAAGAALAGWVHGSRWLLGVWLFIAGLGFGASMGAASTFVTESVPAAATGVATAFLSVMRLVGGGIGSELAAGVLAEVRVGDTAAPSDLAFRIAFTIGAGAALLGAGLALLVPGEQEGNQA